VTTRTRRWIRAHPVWTVFLSLFLTISVPVGISLYTLSRTTAQTKRLTDNSIDYQVANKIDGCRSSNHGRAALQSVLDEAAHPPPTGAARLDFTKVPGWAALSPSTQAYFLSLQVQLARPGGSSYLALIASNYRKTNPSNVDCVKLGADLRRQLAHH
jgi:hypothetical protein